MPPLFALALVVGLVGGIYGIGGGAIIAPFVAAIFGLPIYTIGGAALLGTFITSVAGVATYYCLDERAGSYSSNLVGEGQMTARDTSRARVMTR
jgi:uncharacterized protein